MKKCRIVVLITYWTILHFIMLVIRMLADVRDLSQSELGSVFPAPSHWALGFVLSPLLFTPLIHLNHIKRAYQEGVQQLTVRVLNSMYFNRTRNAVLPVRGRQMNKMQKKIGYHSWFHVYVGWAFISVLESA